VSTPEWIAGPQIRAFSASDFGFDEPHAEAQAALTSDIVAVPPRTATIRVAGAATNAFLQGQLSNDIRELTAARAQLTSWNSAKGRVLAIITALRLDGGDVLLELPAELVEPTLKRLRMFLMRARATLADASTEWQSLGLAGDGCTAALETAGLPAPPETWSCAASGGAIVLRRPGHRPRFTVHGPAPVLASLWQPLTERLRPVGSGAWRLLEILAGVPTVYAATQEHFVAQMLNLDRLGGISFKKGCYTGQEVIARMHYLGNLKRRLYLSYATEAPPLPGQPVYVAGGDGQAAGEIVESAPHPARGHAVLAVLQTAAAENSLRIGAMDGQALADIQALI
jgi:folate-binding protein YgfZ